jgi:hypothetical protein
VISDGWIGEVHPAAPLVVSPPVPAIEPRGQTPPPNVVTIAPGTKMADIERAVTQIGAQGDSRQSTARVDMLDRGAHVISEDQGIPNAGAHLRTRRARTPVIRPHCPFLPSSSSRIVTPEVLSSPKARQSASAAEPACRCWFQPHKTRR